MAVEQSITHKLVERLSSWRGTAIFHARDGRSLRGLVVRLFEASPERAREVVLAAMHRAIAVSHPVIDLALPESERGGIAMVSDIWPGELLEKRLERGPLAVGRALDIARNLAAGLAALHRTGLAHGGVHPANVWLAEDGAVRLLGLGLAAADDRPMTELSASEVAYLAPEVLRQEPAGKAADIWSLGVVMRDCLTGKSDYSGRRTTQLIRSILDKSISRLQGDAPVEIERFLEGALARQVEERFADGEAAHRALLEIPDFLPIDSTRPLRFDEDRQPSNFGDSSVVVGPVSSGAKINGYEVLEVIGRGGMGVVYRARDIRLERDVALKFLPLHVEPKQREDFEREAKAASSLDHPNICTIFGIDESADGDTFIAMAFYDGPSLAERLEAGRLSLEESLEIAEQIASGLEAAHRVGLVHRDIKPGNILFSRDGLVKIVDFGLSAIAEPGSGIIETAELYGTMGYVAPEVLRHEPFDGRADIWALGVVLFEMVSSRKPFQGQELLHLIEVLEDDPPPLGSVAPEAPIELQRIAAKALARQQAKRYSDAGQLATDLRRLRLGEPAGPRKPRAGLLAGIAAATILAVSLLIWLLAAPDPIPERPISFLGLQVADVPPWVGIALEELLELELEERALSHQLALFPQAAEALASLDPERGWPSSTWRDFPAAADSAWLGGRVSSQVDGSLAVRVAIQDPLESARSAIAEGALDQLPSMASKLAIDLFGPVPQDAVQKTSAEVETQRILEDAESLLARLDSPAALEVLARPLEHQAPPLLHLLRATALWDLGKEKEARDAVKLAQAAQLPPPLSLYFRARHQDFARDYGRAAALYRALDEIGAFGQLPRDARLEAAAALIRDGAPREALEWLDSNDDAPRTELIRADAYHWLGEYNNQLQAVERATEKAVADDFTFVLARAQRQGATAAWRRGDFADGLSLARLAAENYRLLDHAKGQADAAMAEGIVLYELGDLVLAKDAYSRSARLYASLGNSRAEARTLTNKALVLEQQGDVAAHLEVTERALELFRQGEDQLAELITLVNLTGPLTQLGRLGEVEAAFVRAEELAQSVGRFEEWVDANHGNYLLTAGRLADARRHLEGARNEQDLAKDEAGMAATDASLAYLFLLDGELEEAQRLLNSCLPIIEQRGSPGDLSAVLRISASVALARDDLAAAHRALQRAARLASPRLEAIKVLKDQAAVALAGGDLQRARRQALEALAEFELRGAELPHAWSLHLLAEIALASGDAELGLERAQMAFALFRGNPEAQLPGPLKRSLRLLELRAQVRLSDPEARDELQALLAEIIAQGDFPLELRARLGIGEAELAAGYQAAGRRRLEDLAAEASEKGFHQLARQARGASH